MENKEMNKEEKIEYILKAFDFERVLKVMRFLNWTWSTVDTEDGVPSMYDLIMNSKSYLSQAYDSCWAEGSDWGVGSGGFRARAFYYEDGIELSLSFELDSFDTF